MLSVPVLPVRMRDMLLQHALPPGLSARKRAITACRARKAAAGPRTCRGFPCHGRSHHDEWEHRLKAAATCMDGCMRVLTLRRDCTVNDCAGPRRSALDSSEHLALLVGSSSTGGSGSNSAPSSSNGAAAAPQGATPVCVHHEQHGVDLLTGVTAATSTVSPLTEAGTLENAPSVSNGSSSSSSSGVREGSLVEGQCAPSSSGSSSLDGALSAVASRGGGVVLYLRSGSGGVEGGEGSSGSRSSGSSSILEQCQALHQQQAGAGASVQGHSAAEGQQGGALDLKAYGLAAQVRVRAGLWACMVPQVTG